jgi:hypothetical protein
MRIKAVLRDSEILGLEPGSNKRILTTALKNLDRLVGWTTLLKVMGLQLADRVQMLTALEPSGIHVWLGKDADQHVIYLSKAKIPEDVLGQGYLWQ